MIPGSNVLTRGEGGRDSDESQSIRVITSVSVASVVD